MAAISERMFQSFGSLLPLPGCRPFSQGTIRHIAEGFRRNAPLLRDPAKLVCQVPLERSLDDLRLDRSRRAGSAHPGSTTRQMRAPPTAAWSPPRRQSGTRPRPPVRTRTHRRPTEASADRPWRRSCGTPPETSPSGSREVDDATARSTMARWALSGSRMRPLPARCEA